MAVKLPLVAPAATVRFAGTVTLVLLLDRATLAGNERLQGFSGLWFLSLQPASSATQTPSPMGSFARLGRGNRIFHPTLRT